MAGDQPSRGAARPDPREICTRADFGRGLTALREAAGLTVRDAAKAMNLPASTMGGYLVGRHLPPLRFPDLLPALVRILGVEDQVEIDAWVEALWRVRRAAGQRPAQGEAPYRGLAAFQPQHAGWFFGREALAGAIVSRVLADGAVIVVGASGSGKSSLLRAGVIPALTGQLATDDPRGVWRVLLFTPGDRPLPALVQRLAGLVDMRGEDAHPAACQALAHRAAAAGADEHAGLVLVIDQFEEVFTSCRDLDQRRDFITAICGLSTPTPDADADGNTDGQVRVVLGLRADFYSHALRYQGLAALLQHAQVVVAPMSQADLRRAITEPARTAGVAFEDGLVDLLLREIAPPATDVQAAAHDPGALPLLGHALLATWDRRRHGTLTVEGYRATGGIHGAVARTAEEAYTALDADQQRLARHLFLRLVHVSDQTADSRRRASRAELLPVLPYTESGRLERVLEAFIDHRLITSSVDTVEIAHEALLTAWPRLRGWIDEDRTGLRVHRRLGDAALAWHNDARDPHRLYRGPALEAARAWAEDPAHRLALNTVEDEFLDASTRAAHAEQDARRRRTHRLHQLIASLTVLVLLVALLAAYAFDQRGIATQQRTLATVQRNAAISRQVAIEANQTRATDTALAAQLALAAYRISPTPEARAALLDSYLSPAATRIPSPASVIQCVAATPDGQTLATCGSSGVAQLWNLRDPGRPALLATVPTGHTYTMFTAAFSQNGHVLALGGAGPFLSLFNVTDPAKPAALGAQLPGFTSTVYAVAFSPDGKTLAAASADHTIRLWDVSEPARPQPLGQPLAGFNGYVQAVAFSPDGRLLAAGSQDTTARIWDVTAPATPRPVGTALTGATKTVYCVAFSPDGRTLAAGSGDGTIHLWDLVGASPTPEGAPLTGPASWVNALAFNPDGTRLAAGDSDSKVWLFDLHDHSVITTLPHPGPVTATVFLPTRGRDTLATGAADGITRIWRLPGPVITPAAKPVFTTAIGPRHLLAIGSGTGTASLWTITDPHNPTPLGPPLTAPDGASPFSGNLQISPDGDTLAIGSNDGTIRLWDIADPAHPALIPTVLIGLTTPVESIAFTPDQHLLAASANEAPIRLWNIADLRHPQPLPPVTGPGNYVFSVAFSSNGNTLAAGSADNTVRLWNVANPARPTALGKPLTSLTNYVYTVAFSPDGRTLAAGSADHTVQLWDVTDPAKPLALGKPLAGPNNYIYTICFSPDGKTLAAATGEGTVWLWDITDPRHPTELAALAATTNALLTVGYDPTSDLLVAGGQDDAVQIWDSDIGHTITGICSTVGEPITSTEWNRYIPDTPYKPPCTSKS